LHLVTFPGRPGGEPVVATHHVPEAVVAATKLWRGVAQTVAGGEEEADVVILVQQVRHEHSEAATTMGASGGVEARVVDACRRLLQSGVADSILTGKVGECCDEQDAAAAGAAAALHAAGPAPFALPFSPAPVGQQQQQRSAVKARALPPSQDGGGHYWGVVVQSRDGATGAEGCYLLKTVRAEDPVSGCACTHFSLTRVCRGENLEAQFVRSWLV
jgi:hypothetical protein